MKSHYLFILIISWVLYSPLYAQESTSKKYYQEFSLDLSSDYRYFFQEGLYNGQEQHFLSIAAEPSYHLEWKEGTHSLKFTGFFRYENRDSRRTHGDIREFYWQWVKDNWEVSAGAKKIFWGVTESAHLVDVINQTDVVESFDGEQKLGQPMVHAAFVSKFGTFDVFAMTYSRRRQFPVRAGRLRPPFNLEKEAGIYESDMEAWHPDFAIHWGHSLGAFDAGLSHFYGTAREPVFQIEEQTGAFDLIYPINHQTGLELQAISGPAIWKWEGIYRQNSFQDVFAFAGGLEYTFGNIASSGLDIGLLAEYLYDDRGDFAPSGMDNDLFFGSRIAFNDMQSTEILLGGIIDLNKNTRVFSLEASRRFGASWKIEAEARIFSKVDQNDLFLNFLREDSFGQLRVVRYF